MRKVLPPGGGACVADVDGDGLAVFWACGMCWVCCVCCVDWLLSYWLLLWSAADMSGIGIGGKFSRSSGMSGGGIGGWPLICSGPFALFNSVDQPPLPSVAPMLQDTWWLPAVQLGNAMVL